MRSLLFLVLPFLAWAVPLKRMRFRQAPASATPLPETQSKTPVEGKEYHKFFETLRQGEKLDANTDAKVRSLEKALGVASPPPTMDANSAPLPPEVQQAAAQATAAGLPAISTPGQPVTNASVSSLENRIADHAYTAAKGGLALPGEGTSTYFKLSPHVSGEAVINLQNVHAQLIKNAGATAGLTATPGTPEYEQQLKQILGVKGEAAAATGPSGAGGLKIHLGAKKGMVFESTANGTIAHAPMPGAPPFGMDHDMVTPGGLAKTIVNGHITHNGNETISANTAQKHLVGAIASVADSIDKVESLSRKSPQYHGKGMYVNVFNALTPPPPAPIPTAEGKEDEEPKLPGLVTPPELLNPLSTVLPFRAPESPCQAPDCTVGSQPGAAPMPAGVSSKFINQPQGNDPSTTAGVPPVDVQSLLPVKPAYKPDYLSF